MISWHNPRRSPPSGSVIRRLAGHGQLWTIEMQHRGPLPLSLRLPGNPAAQQRCNLFRQKIVVEVEEELVQPFIGPAQAKWQVRRIVFGGEGHSDGVGLGQRGGSLDL